MCKTCKGTLDNCVECQNEERRIPPCCGCKPDYTEMEDGECIIVCLEERCEKCSVDQKCLEVK